MISKIKNMLLVAATAMALLAPVAVTTGVVYADDEIKNGLCQGTNLQVGQTDCSVDEEGATTTINDILTDVINIFSIVVGVVAVIMIIVGGFKYITSGGDSGNVSSAKNTIIFALVGLVIVALSQFIVHFVLGKATGAGE